MSVSTVVVYCTIATRPPLNELAVVHQLTAWVVEEAPANQFGTPRVMPPVIWFH